MKLLKKRKETQKKRGMKLCKQEKENFEKKE